MMKGDSSYGELTRRSNSTREQKIHLKEKGKMPVGKEEEGMAKRKSCLRPGTQRKAKGRTKDIHPALKSCIRKRRLQRKSSLPALHLREGSSAT